MIAAMIKITRIGIANVPDQELGIHDAKDREEEDENRQLKAYPETKNDGHKEAGVVLDREDGMETLAKVEQREP